MVRAGLILAGLLLFLRPAAAQPPEPAPPPPAPVVFEGEELFIVHDVFGILTPEDRANAAAKRLGDLADDPFYAKDALTIEDRENVTRILYDGDPIAFVTDEDAAAERLSRSEVAAQRIQIIDRAVKASRERRRPEHASTAAIEALAATVVLALVLWALRFAYRKLLPKMSAAKPHLGISPEPFAAFKRRALKVAAVALLAVVVLVYLQTVFTILPPTRGYALTVLRWVVTPIGRVGWGLIHNIGNLVTIVVLIVLLRYALKLLRAVLESAARGSFRIPGVAPDWCMPLYKVVRMVVIALGAVMIYPYVPGSDSAAFKGISLFAGALFTLGASGTVGNFVGGLVAIFAGAFRIGDWVRLGDVTGEVLETTMLLTRVRTEKDEIVTIPNGSILSATLVNYSTRARTTGVILHTSVTIGYDAPWRTVHALLLDAAGRTGHLLHDPAPFVLQRALDDFYVRYEINAYTREPTLTPFIYAELHRNIQDAFNEGGVEIMSPHYTSLRDGNTVTTPADKRPQGYTPKPFRVRVDEGKVDG